MRQVTIADLPALIGTRRASPDPVLLCDSCGEQYSACKGDYFMAEAETVMRCSQCGRLLRLVRMRTIAEDWDPVLDAP